MYELADMRFCELSIESIQYAYYDILLTANTYIPMHVINLDRGPSLFIEQVHHLFISVGYTLIAL